MNLSSALCALVGRELFGDVPGESCDGRNSRDCCDGRDRRVFCGWGDEQWEELYVMAVRQRVEGIVWDALCDWDLVRCMGEDVRVKWGCSAAIVEDGYKLRYDVGRRVCLALREAGVRYRVLKGVAAASMYPVPSHRKSSDIDILLGDSVGEAHKVLEAKFGVSIALGKNHHDKTVIDGVEVELHRDLFNLAKHRSNVVLQREMMSMYDSSRRTFELLFLVHHAGQHFVDGEMSLLNICDVGLCAVKYGPEIDFAQVRRVARQCGFEQFYDAVGAILVGRLRMVPVDGWPDAVSDALVGRVYEAMMSPMRVSASRVGRSVLYQMRWFMANRWKQKLVYGQERVITVWWFTVLYWLRSRLGG